jgi:hypothetical protein
MKAACSAVLKVSSERRTAIVMQQRFERLVGVSLGTEICMIAA